MLYMKYSVLTEYKNNTKHYTCDVAIVVCRISYREIMFNRIEIYIDSGAKSK